MSDKGNDAEGTEGIHNLLSPTEIRVLVNSHALMLSLFCSKYDKGVVTKSMNKALLDTVARVYSLLEAYPIVDDPPPAPAALEPTVH